MYIQSNKPMKLLCNKNTGIVYVWDTEFFENIKEGDNEKIQKFVLYTGKSSMISLKGIDGATMLFYVKPHKRIITLSSQRKRMATIPPVLIRCTNYLSTKPNLGVYICIKRKDGQPYISSWPYGNVSSGEEASVCMGSQYVLSFYTYLKEVQEKTNQLNTPLVHVDILPYLICIYSAFFDSVFNGDITRMSISDILTEEEVKV